MKGQGTGAFGELLSTKEAAEMLSVPPATLRWWRHAGTGPRSFLLSPRKVRYLRSDIEEWLRAKYEGVVA